LKRSYLALLTRFTLLGTAGLLPMSAMADHGAAISLDELQVTGQRIAPAKAEFEELQREQRLTPGGVTLVEMEQVKEGHVGSLADMLRYAPGVFAVSRAGNDSLFFSSRGSNLDTRDFSMNGIKLLQDGLPVTAADGNNHNRIIDPLSAQYATVARGANGMKYGASTLGGAIDFITPTAYDLPPLTLGLTLGSHGLRHSRLTASGVVDNRLDGTVIVEDKQLRGYRDQSRQRREGLYANAGIQLTDDISTRFYITRLQDNIDLPGALTRQQFRDNPRQANPDAIPGGFARDVDTTRFANKTTWEIDENRMLEAGIAYERQQLFHPIVFNPFFSLLIDNEQQDVSTMLRYHHRVGDHQWLFGMNYGVNQVRGGQYENDRGRRGAQRTSVRNDADTLELFALDRWQFAPRWTLVAGAQFVSAQRETKSTNVNTGAVMNPDDRYQSINPTAGLIYALTPEVSLYSNISRLYEPPTNYQLEDETSQSNAALKAMKGEVFEVGSRGHHDLSSQLGLNWDVSLYYARIRDEILSVENPAQPGTNISSNIDDTVHAGIEALISADWLLDSAGVHRITPIVNMTFNHFRFRNDDLYNNNQLPAAPRYFARGEILYRHQNGFYAGPTVDRVGQRYADFANNYQLSSYTLFGLKAGWANERLSVFAEVRNLQDRDHVSSSSVRTRAVESDAILNSGEPRSVYAGVELRF